MTKFGGIGDSRHKPDVDMAQDIIPPLLTAIHAGDTCRFEAIYPGFALELNDTQHMNLLSSAAYSGRFQMALSLLKYHNYDSFQLSRVAAVLGQLDPTHNDRKRLLTILRRQLRTQLVMVQNKYQLS